MWRPWQEKCTLKQACWQDLGRCGRDTPWNSLWRIHAGQVHDSLSPRRVASFWSSGRVGGALLLSRKEPKRRCVMNWCNPHCLPCCATGGEDVEDLSLKLSLGKQEKWGKGVPGSGFISYLCFSDLVGNKFNFPKVGLFCPENTLAKESCLPVLLSIHEPFIVLFSPVLLQRGVAEQLCGPLAGINPLQLDQLCVKLYNTHMDKRQDSVWDKF